MLRVGNISGQQLSAFRRKLLRWYDAHRRPLPWRDISDPYRTWISEIMLQQTRVAAVLDHYTRFLRRFATVGALARAPESDVLAAWSGLGYYRRARMLHRAAREIVRNRGGRLPRTAAEWRELPGIGRYTAAAISSIAYGECIAVVDGNVQRVLGRMLAADVPPPLRDLWAAAESLVSSRRAGDFNQAMMELGATVCLPGVPGCETCPVSAWCRSAFSGRFRTTARKPKASPVRHKQEMTFALHVRQGNVRLRRRPAATSLMAGMWELPQAEPNGQPIAAMFRHSVTVTDYCVAVVKTPASDGRWIPLSRAARLPLTGLTRKILRHFQLIQ